MMRLSSVCARRTGKNVSTPRRRQAVPPAYRQEAAVSLLMYLRDINKAPAVDHGPPQCVWHTDWGAINHLNNCGGVQRSNKEDRHSRILHHSVKRARYDPWRMFINAVKLL